MRLTEAFDHVYVINLPARQDRRRDMTKELARVGVAADDSRVTFFPAIRPDDQGYFPSIGARGCFLSHLGVLKDARERGLNRILITEDDLTFSNLPVVHFDEALGTLDRFPWGIFYGGHRLSQVPTRRVAPTLVELEPGEPVMTTHMVAFQGDVIERLILFLEAMLARPAGDPEGGPMHVDGAYTTFRRRSPEVVTLAAHPVLGDQRSSRSDIGRTAWYDRTPFIRDGVGFLRRVRNAVK